MKEGDTNKSKETQKTNEDRFAVKVTVFVLVIMGIMLIKTYIEYGHL